MFLLTLASGAICQCGLELLVQEEGCLPLSWSPASEEGETCGDCCHERDEEEDEGDHEDGSDCPCCVSGPDLAVLGRDGGSNDVALTMVFINLAVVRPGTGRLAGEVATRISHSRGKLRIPGVPGSLYARHCLLLV